MPAIFGGFPMKKEREKDIIGKENFDRMLV